MAALSILRRPVLSGRLRQAPSLLFRPASCSPRSFSSYLISPSELQQALKTQSPSPAISGARIIPLCAAWFMPNDGRTGIQAFRDKRIPKARFFDLDKVVDRHSPYPHMLPSARDFAAAMSELGIRRDDAVVVYDTHELGIFSAPRVGWTLRVFGHPKVHLLNNFRLWVQEGLPTESGELYSVECGSYPIPELDHARVAHFEDIKHVVEARNQDSAEKVQLLDARSAARWSGRDSEPRPGLASGHMPGSINLPYIDLLDPDTKAFYPAQKIKQILQAKGLDPAKPIINTCGTGVTACVVEAALQEVDFGSPRLRKLYDGSWTEWAQRVEPSESLIETLNKDSR